NLVINSQNLCVTRPVEANVKNFVGRYAVQPGGTSQLHARRSDGVKGVRCQPATSWWRKRIPAGWSGLRAVGERIPARQLQLVVHLMVNPNDEGANLVGIGTGYGLGKSAAGHGCVSCGRCAGDNPTSAIRTRIKLQ